MIISNNAVWLGLDEVKEKREADEILKTVCEKHQTSHVYHEVLSFKVVIGFEGIATH